MKGIVIPPFYLQITILCLLLTVAQLLHIPLSVQKEKINDFLTIEASMKKKQCTAPREGLIVLNTLGLLANDLFEVAYANRLAADLCWDVVLYRPKWNNELPSQRGFECFPNAMLPEDFRDLSKNHLTESLQKKLKFNTSRWEAMTVELIKDEEEEESNEKDNSNEEEESDEEDNYDEESDDYFELTAESDDRYFEWVEELEHKGLATRLEHLKFDFTGNGTEMLVERIRDENSKISMVSLEAFFIHHDWMASWMSEIREWLTMNDSCCYNQPADDAVVIHVRDFDDPDDGSGIEASVYTHILNHYNMTERPLWIVCQPKSADSDYVKEIVNGTPNKSATIVTGRDQYDAFCTLTRAKTLLLSAASTFSQMGAMLADPAVEVHFPIPTLDKPRVTMSVPTWKYHLVAGSLDKVEEFDVNLDRLSVEMA